mmetsp:Transcript_3395/g.6280  ORF Transcript_3395/g.6280 Transcript_3395/m.6280 type:complete len:96 (+) Transcript_3395:155-442(+)
MNGKLTFEGINDKSCICKISPDLLQDFLDTDAASMRKLSKTDKPGAQRMLDAGGERLKARLFRVGTLRAVPRSWEEVADASGAERIAMTVVGHDD